MIRLVTAVAFAALVARAAAGATNVCEATAYIAPVNQLIFRMVSPGGGVREFERVLDAPGSLRGADGWSGIMGEGGLIDVESPDGTEKYRFDRGRLVVSDIKGEKKAPFYSF